MDWLTFVSNMTTALAWPGAALVLGLLYRRQIRDLFGSMKKLKVGPMEAELFERGAKEVRQLATELPSLQLPPSASFHAHVEEHAQAVDDSTAHADSGATRRDDYLLDMVAVTPRLAIIEAWSLVERTLRSSLGVKATNLHVNAGVLLLELRRKGILSDSEFGVLKKLFDLRNEAVGGAFITYSSDAALDYVVAATTLVDKLESPG